MDDVNADQVQVTSHLPYLTAVVNETLRRYPGIIGSQQRITTTDTTVGGVHVPKDASLA